MKGETCLMAPGSVGNHRGPDGNQSGAGYQSYDMEMVSTRARRQEITPTPSHNYIWGQRFGDYIEMVPTSSCRRPPVDVMTDSLSTDTEQEFDWVDCDEYEEDGYSSYRFRDFDVIPTSIAKNKSSGNTFTAPSNHSFPIPMDLLFLQEYVWNSQHECYLPATISALHHESTDDGSHFNSSIAQECARYLGGGHRLNTISSVLAPSRFRTLDDVIPCSRGIKPKNDPYITSESNGAPKTSSEGEFWSDSLVSESEAPSESEEGTSAAALAQWHSKTFESAKSKIGARPYSPVTSTDMINTKSRAKVSSYEETISEESSNSCGKPMKEEDMAVEVNMLGSGTELARTMEKLLDRIRGCDDDDYLSDGDDETLQAASFVNDVRHQAVDADDVIRCSRTTAKSSGSTSPNLYSNDDYNELNKVYKSVETLHQKETSCIKDNTLTQRYSQSTSPIENDINTANYNHNASSIGNYTNTTRYSHKVFPIGNDIKAARYSQNSSPFEDDTNVASYSHNSSPFQDDINVPNHSHNAFPTGDDTNTARYSNNSSNILRSSSYASNGDALSVLGKHFTIESKEKVEDSDSSEYDSDEHLSGDDSLLKRSVIPSFDLKSALSKLAPDDDICDVSKAPKNSVAPSKPHPSTTYQFMAPIIKPKFASNFGKVRYNMNRPPFIRSEFPVLESSVIPRGSRRSPDTSNGYSAEMIERKLYQK